MDLAALVGLAIRASIFLIVFGLGLGSTRADALSLLHRPRLLVRSLVSMNAVMPLVAAGLAQAFDFHQAVKITLIALAVSRVPPILPRKELKAGGPRSYAIGLLVVAAVLAIVLVPFSVEAIGRLFQTEVRVPASAVARLVAITVLVPIVAGIIVRSLAPALAARLSGPILLGATVLLGIGTLLILFQAWPAAMTLVGNGHVLAIAAFVVIGLAVGHLLGGPDPDERAVLALSTATRHPGVALAIAGITFPAQKLVMGAVLLYLLMATVLSIPYVSWRRRQLAGAPRSAQT